MSVFDMHVRKVENDWVKRLPWQNGTDGALLREVFDIYEKWGMSNLIPAFAAVKHVFGQDSQKAISVEAAGEGPGTSQSFRSGRGITAREEANYCR